MIFYIIAFKFIGNLYNTLVSHIAGDRTIYNAIHLPRPEIIPVLNQFSSERKAVLK